MTSSIRRCACAAALVLAAVAAGVAPSSAQAPALPTLTITLASGKAPALEPTTLQPGATEIVARSAGKERDFIVARLRSPDARPEVDRIFGSRKEPSERQIDRLGKRLTVFVAQNSAAKGRDSRTMVNLEPGTYYVIDITGRARITTLEVAGDVTTAVLPDAGATIDMRDYKWAKYQRTLPADGTLRVRNRGKQLHFMLAFPTSSSRNASRLEALLRSRSRTAERRAERYVAGPPTEPVGLISPGTENRVKVDLRPGHYVLVCFYGSPASRNRQHNQLGMARKVRFR